MSESFTPNFSTRPTWCEEAGVLYRHLRAGEEPPTGLRSETELYTLVTYEVLHRPTNSVHGPYRVLVPWVRADHFAAVLRAWNRTADWWYRELSRKEAD